MLATPKETVLCRSSAAKRPSPSPSIKKAKVERLIKEHGSPPGRRVTAGGRIVPTDFSFANPSHYYPPWLQTQSFHATKQLQPNGLNISDLPNGLVGYNTSQKLCQIVDGQFREIKEGNLYMAAPNLPFPIVSLPQHALPATDPMGLYNYQQPPRVASPPPIGLNFMEAVERILELGKMPLDQQIDWVTKTYDQVHRDCNQLERLAILKEKEIDTAGRAKIIQKKMDYVRQMNDLRKLRRQLEDVRDASTGFVSPFAPSSASNIYVPLTGMRVSQPFQQFYGNTFDESLLKTLAALISPVSSGMQSVVPTSMASSIAPQVFSVGSNTTTQSFVTAPSNGGPISPNSANSTRNKRSHAIEIKPPTEKNDKHSALKSSLDPRSPAFQAATTFLPPSPSMIASPEMHPAITNTWLDEKVAMEESPDSSISTTNFFPNDASEHSQIKHTFHIPVDAHVGAQVSAFSGQIHNTTPQKDWAQNSHVESHSTSPETYDGHLPKSNHVSPFDRRVVSGYQDPSAHFGAMKASTSPEYVRNGVKEHTQSPAVYNRHNSLDHSPLHAPGPEPKSELWYSGYQVGLQGKDMTFNTAEMSNEFLTGFFEGKTYHLKSSAALKTPEKRSSPRSSQASLHSGNPQAHSYAATPAARKDSAVHIPVASNNLAREYGSQENFHRAPRSYPSIEVPMSANYPSRLPVSDYGPSTTLYASSADLTPRRTVSSIVRPAYGRGHSGSPVELATMSPTSGHEGYVWKDVNVQSFQASKPTSEKLSEATSGNRHSSNGVNVKSKSSTLDRWTPGHRIWQPVESRFEAIGVRRRLNHSQVDGAVDDLAELDANTMSAPKNEKKSSTPINMSSKPAAAGSSKFIESSVSTPKTQEAPKQTSSSPTKVKDMTGRVKNHIKKAAGVADKQEETDPAKMTAKQKDRRRSQWRTRFRELRADDHKEAKEYRKNTPLP